MKVLLQIIFFLVGGFRLLSRDEVVFLKRFGSCMGETKRATRTIPIIRLIPVAIFAQESCDSTNLDPHAPLTEVASRLYTLSKFMAVAYGAICRNS